MAGEEEGSRNAGVETGAKMGMPVTACPQCGKPVYIGRSGEKVELISVTIFVEGEVSFAEEHEPGFFCHEDCVKAWADAYVGENPMLTYVTGRWTAT